MPHFYFSLLSLFLAFGLLQSSAQECGFIYITPNGASTGSAGTKANPANFDYGFSLVDATNDHIRLAHGVYELTQTLDIPSNLVIEGGFEEGTWVKTNADSSIIHRDASNYDVANNALIALKVENQSNFRIQDITIKVDDAPGNGVSIYGIYLAGCSEYAVSRCIIITGKGSDGLAGAQGQQGISGANGGDGDTGQAEGPCCRAGGAGGTGSFPGSNPGGVGGDGGEWGGFDVFENCDPIFNFCTWTVVPDSEFTNPGNNGENGTGNGGGVGGIRGAGVCDITYATNTCAATALNHGEDGTDGLDGVDGAQGLQGIAGFAGGFYAPGVGETGDVGFTDGAGGGGGGGGGAKGCEPAAIDVEITQGSSPYNGDTVYNTAGTGAGGGGGGEGGQRGFGGIGGSGGGGAFCVFTYNNGINGIVQDCEFLPGDGGLGGDGGAGGLGGFGGQGGLGGALGDNGPGMSCNNGEGGDGGRGGDGGQGGEGGRGSDGASEGLFQLDGIPVLDPDIYNQFEPEVRVEYFGCTNSNVVVETNATGIINWIFGFGAEPANSTLALDTVQYTGLLGSRNLTLIVDGVPYFYANYLLIEEDFTPPEIDASRNTICAGESTDLSTTFIGDTYSWTIPGGSITSSTDQNPGSVTFSTPGEYVLELVTTSCCGTSRTTDTIFVIEQVEPDLGPDLRACFLGDLPVLDGDGNDGADYTWYLNGFPTGLPQRFLETTVTGTYSVEVSYGQGCSGTDSVEVEIYTISPVDLGENQAICEGNPLPILNAGIDSADYAWTLDGNPIGTNTINLEVNLPGTYSVTVVEQDGCSGEDEVEVLVSDPSVFLGSDISYCSNETFPILDADNQGSTYEWFFEGQSIAGATEQTLQTSAAGTYEVVITNIYGCQATDDIELIEYSPISATISGPNTATLGATVQFQDQTPPSTPPVNSWTWNFGDGSTLNNTPSPSHAFLDIGVRPVLMIADNGFCSDTAYLEVDVNWDCPQIGLTAAFATNTDTVILSGLANVELTNNSQNATQYLWDFGDGTPLDPTVDPIHPYIDPGTYTITLTAINYNCTTSTSQSITVIEFGVGVEESLLEGAVNVYPNPNTGIFVVELDLQQPSNILIELNNALGQRVYQTRLEQERHWLKEFDLSSFVKGIYSLRVATEHGVAQCRIVIQ